MTHSIAALSADITIGRTTMAEENPVEFDCELLNETAKAWKVEIQLTSKKKKHLWVAKSQAELVANKKGAKITIAYWLANKEGLL